MKFLTNLVYHAKFLSILTLFMLALNLCIGYIYIVERKDSMLHVSFLDIGQGDSIFIQTPEKHSFLIDSGPITGDVSSKIGQLLPFYRRTIDMLLETHPDADHIGGFQGVLNAYHINGFIEPGLRSDTSTDNDLHQSLQEKGIVEIKARKGMTIMLDKAKNIYFTVFFPDRDVSTWQSHTNDASIVGKLVYGNKSFLFTGDSPINIEDYLIKTLKKGDLMATVLKVGHHGSKNSTSPEFLQAVKPTYGVISVGAGNRYGHPTAEVLNNLAHQNVITYRTDKQGTIYVKTDGNFISLDAKP